MMAGANGSNYFSRLNRYELVRGILDYLRYPMGRNRSMLLLTF